MNSGIASASFINSSLAGNGTGLLGAYYSGQFKTFIDPPTLVRIDPIINFGWEFGTPDPLISTDFFTVRWTGCVQPAIQRDLYFLCDGG
ncbi:MAG: hypothetical protein WDN00_04805 [Limisphaerales bacterium]